MISSMKFNLLTYQSSSLRKYLSILSFSCAFNDKNSLLCHLLGHLKNLATLKAHENEKIERYFLSDEDWYVRKLNFIELIIFKK